MFRPQHVARAMAKLEELRAAAMALGALAFVRIDCRTPNPLNGIGAGSRIALSRTRKRQRELAAHLVALELRGRPALPCVVLVRRVTPSSGLDPHDSLPASLKSIVDGIADALGLASDRDARVRWTYAQRRGVPGEHAVEVTVWPTALHDECNNGDR
jgi:hypothetical protein